MPTHFNSRGIARSNSLSYPIEEVGISRTVMLPMNEHQYKIVHDIRVFLLENGITLGNVFRVHTRGVDELEPHRLASTIASHSALYRLTIRQVVAKRDLTIQFILVVIGYGVHILQSLFYNNIRTQQLSVLVRINLLSSASYRFIWVV